MKCSKLIDRLQRLEYELDDPEVMLKINQEYDMVIEIQVENHPTGKRIVIM